MASGDSWIHQMWSGDFVYFVVNQVDDPTKYGFLAPSEGTPINSDTYAIPANAAHPGTALLFIDYMLRTEERREEDQVARLPDADEGRGGDVRDAGQGDPRRESHRRPDKPTVFRTQTPEDKGRSARVWTEVKAS